MNSDLPARLREQGYRLTPQRLMVLEALAAAGDHVSAEDIHREVAARYPYINLSTVYRTLDLLATERVVRTAEVGEDRRLYELATLEPHHHLACRRCARIVHVEAVDVSAIEERVGAEHGFAVDETVLTSFGTCRECREQAGQ